MEDCGDADVAVEGVVEEVDMIVLRFSRNLSSIPC
jgi:hypothetical protein